MGCPVESHPSIFLEKNQPMTSNLSNHFALDEDAWLAVCKKESAEAQRCCGLSWDYRCELFSRAIDAQVEKLPDEHRARALEIARDDWDYLTPTERIEAQRACIEEGYCVHGIPEGHCPLGCGSAE